MEILDAVQFTILFILAIIMGYMLGEKHKQKRSESFPVELPVKPEIAGDFIKIGKVMIALGKDGGVFFMDSIGNYVITQSDKAEIALSNFIKEQSKQFSV